MQAGYVVLSLLLAAAIHAGDATFVTGGAGAALALAFGVAAVVGIGALGIGVAAASRRGRGRRFGRRRGFGGRRYRGRRDVLDTDEEDEDADLWEMIGASDRAGCARKLICLLEAADGVVDADEAAVLGFLGQLTDVTQPLPAAKLPFETAGWLGKLRGAAGCQRAFGAQCPHSRQQMMDVVRSVWGRDGSVPAPQQPPVLA